MECEWPQIAPTEMQRTQSSNVLSLLPRCCEAKFAKHRHEPGYRKIINEQPKKLRKIKQKLVWDKRLTVPGHPHWVSRHLHTPCWCDRACGLGW